VSILFFLVDAYACGEPVALMDPQIEF